MSLGSLDLVTAPTGDEDDDDIAVRNIEMLSREENPSTDHVD